MKTLRGLGPRKEAMVQRARSGNAKKRTPFWHWREREKKAARDKQVPQ